MNEKVKMFLFARWIATCYADSHLDDSMKCEHNKGFDSSSAISVLNRENGQWYKEQIEHFEKIVYPNYLKNGSVESVQRFFKEDCPDKENCPYDEWACRVYKFCKNENTKTIRRLGSGY